MASRPQGWGDTRRPPLLQVLQSWAGGCVFSFLTPHSGLTCSLCEVQTPQRCSSSPRQASGGSFLSQGLKGSETILTLMN